MSSFLNMGGYAFYVWTSYGAAFAVLVWNLVSPWLKRRELRRRLAEEVEPLHE